MEVENVDCCADAPADWPSPIHRWLSVETRVTLADIVEVVRLNRLIVDA
jgi:hypothetical protein